jgi:hypothetical protein
MTLFREVSPQESRAAEKVYALISLHSDGITFYELMHSHKDQVSDNSSVLAAIKLLIRQEKVSSVEPWEGVGYLQNVKLYSNPIKPTDV